MESGLYTDHHKYKLGEKLFVVENNSFSKQFKKKVANIGPRH